MATRKADAPVQLPRGRHKLPREFVVASQRERILDAMAEVSAAKGYGAVSVADVVSRAGVSRSTFYELFRDREECFLAAYDAILAQFVGTVTAAYAASGEWVDRVRAAVDSALTFMASEPAFARMCMIEVLAAGPRALERYTAAVRILASLVDQGQAYSPDGAALPSTVGRFTIAGAAGLIREQILAGNTERLPELVPDILYAICASFLGHEQALAVLQQDPPRR